MPFLRVVLITVLSTSPVLAKPLTCVLQINSQRSIRSEIETFLNERTPIAHTGEAEAFITEKQNHLYVIEAFIPGVDARIYSEGTLKESSDILKTSLWGRDLLVDIQCSPTR